MKANKLLITVLLQIVASCAMGQVQSYRCTYESKINLPEDVSNSVGNDIGQMLMQALSQNRTYYVLTYSDGKSLFERDEKLSDESMITSNSTVYVDYKAGQQVTQEEFMSRKFLISEPLQASQWHLQNEQRNIAGRKCSKAIIVSETNKTDSIVAWYSPETPIPAGPMGYCGLPGLIVELNMGGILFTLTEIKVIDTPVEIKAPTKGKKVSREEYVKLMDQKMKEYGVDNNSEGGLKVIQLGN